MQMEWKIGPEDVQEVLTLLEKQADNRFVRERKAKNLAPTKPPVDRDRFWSRMVAMRLTSVQRSGPKSAIGRFISKSPFPLSYDAVRTSPHQEGFIANALSAAGGIRFVPTIADHLAKNFRLLEGGEWDVALGQCNRLTQPVPAEEERDVADYIRGTFAGFGPKQSRNLLQALGLTRYEIPIDSRVAAWLNDRLGLPIRLSALGLADPSYYDFVSNGIQALCAECEIFPCVLDAAIFSIEAEDGWDHVDPVY
ncbi:hypothetical protein [Sinorhizobium fredii]|uniref:hypothetical protein n=1 Tax=Rhizobium fredii TaxID=380 RepID=UPI0035110A13